MTETNHEKKKKILYLITKSNFGGAQKQVYELATEAMRRAYDVVVACGGTGEKNAHPGLLVEKLLSSGITVRPINHFVRDMSLVDDMRAFFETLQLVLREKPDILHVTSSKAGGLGVIAGRLAGVKSIVFTSHGLTMDETWRPWWQRLLITWFTWLTIFFSHRSIMISTETYNRVKQLPLVSNRVTLVFNGIDSVNFYDTDEARTKLLPDQPNDIFWIGGVGELHPNKNWTVLVESLTHLPPNVHAVIIGEGEEREALEKQITSLNLKERVHLLGYLDAAQYLKAFDIFVLPSKKEGLPYVLLEAGLASLPVIASDLPGNHDIITHEYSGLLIAPEAIILAENVKKLMDLPDLRKHYGEVLQKHVVEKFSKAKMLEKTFSLY